MTTSLFTKQLTILSLIIGLILLAFHYVPALAPYTLLSWMSWALFIGLSILMFYFGRQAAQSENKHTFTNVVMGFVAGKMFISLMLILVYNTTVKPESKLFILPFFLVYLVYTIYETYFMMKLGKMEPTPN